MSDHSPSSPPPARWPLALFALTLLGVLSVLVWLRGELRESAWGVQRGAAAQFEGGILGEAGSLDFRYRDVIDTVERLKRQALIQEVILFKYVGPRNGLVLIFPYWLQWENREEGTSGLSRVDGLMKHDLRDQRGELIGRLYLRLDQSLLKAVDAVVLAVALLLLGAGWMLVSRLRRHEIKLKSTTIELEEKRRQLIQLERLALTGRLTAGLLHDLRKPVQAIRASARARADEDGDFPTKTTEVNDEVPPLDSGVGPLDSVGGAGDPGAAWERVIEQTDAFQGILNATKIERFARGSAARSGATNDGDAREWCDIHDLLERSLSLVQYEQRDVEVVREYTDDILLLEADPYEMIQVFSNAILNAYQAMEGRGQLVMRTSREASPSQDNAEFVARIEIVDSGPGIPEEQLNALFEPFQTTREETGGSGLGLYIAREIISDYGGLIILENKPENSGESGAVFQVRIPLPSEEEDEGAEA